MYYWYDTLIMLLEAIGFIAGIGITVAIGYLIGCYVYDKFYDDEDDDD